MICQLWCTVTNNLNISVQLISSAFWFLLPLCAVYHSIKARYKATSESNKPTEWWPLPLKDAWINSIYACLCFSCCPPSSSNKKKKTQLNVVDCAVWEKILQSSVDEGETAIIWQLCLFVVAFILPIFKMESSVFCCALKQGRILGLKPSGISQCCCFIFCVLIKLLLFGFLLLLFFIFLNSCFLLFLLLFLFFSCEVRKFVNGVTSKSFSDTANSNDCRLLKHYTFYP